MARVSPAVDLHVPLGRAERPLPYLARDELPALERELPELTPEGVEGGSRIDERRHDHVPRRPARTIEIRDFHVREMRRRASLAGASAPFRVGVADPAPPARGADAADCVGPPPAGRARGGPRAER